jgi:uncharacterized protein YcbK (DUF882 family)
MYDENSVINQINVSRRRLLKASLAGSVLAVAPLSTVWAANERSLSLYNLHTGERVNQPYWMAGNYLPESLSAINTVLRDHRSGEVAHMDRGLFDLLHQVATLSGKDARFEVISGYRSPATNAMLNARSSGVAKRSLHMDGRAIDVRLAGYRTDRVRDLALSLKAGGVGFYRKSDFVHLDTGRVRTWGG